MTCRRLPEFCECPDRTFIHGDLLAGVHDLPKSLSAIPGALPEESRSHELLAAADTTQFRGGHTGDIAAKSGESEFHFVANFNLGAPFVFSEGENGLLVLSTGAQRYRCLQVAVPKARLVNEGYRLGLSARLIVQEGRC